MCHVGQIWLCGLGLHVPWGFSICCFSFSCFRVHFLILAWPVESVGLGPLCNVYALQRLRDLRSLGFQGVLGCCA